MPSYLSLLCINNSNYIPNAPCDFYCSGLVAAVKKVTTEIFLEDLVMSAATFEDIVKAASNSQRLTFYG